jgi:hypothetical protein
MVINVKEFKERLKDVPDDYIVVMSSDAEGNNYSPLYELDKVMYVPENSYMGTISSIIRKKLKNFGKMK